MIDFACKQISIDEIIKCSFSLTKTELIIFQFLAHRCGEEFSSHKLSSELEVDITTIQKAVKKLYEKGVLDKKQRNLEGGGYCLYYQCISKDKIKEVIFENFRNFSQKMEQSIQNW